jgi:hypothetical protein
MYPISRRATLKPLSRSAAILAILLAASTVRAEGPAGRILGWVEDAQGSPLPGAVISLFGRGVGSMGVVTLSDSAGRFSVPSLPPGAYTLRALRDGHTPAPARRVLILPNQDATFTISMSPVGDPTSRDSQDAKAAAKDDDASATRELQWLIRHKRRSALEDRAQSAQTADADAPPTGLLASLFPDLAGTLQVVTNPIGTDVADEVEPSSWSVVRLNGRIADSGRWSLGGLVAERESATWRMAASSYSSRAAATRSSRHRVRHARAAPDAPGLRSHAQRSRRGRRVLPGPLAGHGSHHGHAGRPIFLRGLPAAVEPSRSHVRGRVPQRRERAAPRPGPQPHARSRRRRPDRVHHLLRSRRRLLDAGRGAAAERILHYELGFDQEMGDFTVEGHAFYETIHDQLVNGFTTSAVLPHA